MGIMRLFVLMLVLSFVPLIYSQSDGLKDSQPQAVDPLVKDAGNNFQSDGCTMWFDGEYKGCCEKHDLAYFKSSGWRSRLKADNGLFKCVANLGPPYLWSASIMWIGVRIFGSSWFPIHKKRILK